MSTGEPIPGALPLLQVFVVLHPDDHPDRADLEVAATFSNADEAFDAAAPGERVWTRLQTPWMEITRAA